MTCRHKVHHVSFVSPDVRRGLVLWGRVFALKLLDNLNFDNNVVLSVQYGICTVIWLGNRFVICTELN
jgi:hypothetical protein